MDKLLNEYNDYIGGSTYSLGLILGTGYRVRAQLELAAIRWRYGDSPRYSELKADGLPERRVRYLLYESKTDQRELSDDIKAALLAILITEYSNMYYWYEVIRIAPSGAVALCTRLIADNGNLKKLLP